MAKKMDMDSFQYFWVKLKTWVLGNLNNKVDKVPGKGLSVNDYDNISKNKVDAIPSNPKYTDTTYTAGDGISIDGNVISATGGGGGGEENVIEIVKVNGSALTPDANKAVNILVPTALSALSDDATHRVVTDSEKSTWNGKSDFSGSYNDLKNKPTIPTVPTNVSAFTNDAGYLTQHQSLTNYVQKSQTAGLLKNDGTVDTNTYLTSHQDISGKADKITIASSMPSGGFLPNVVYNLGALSGDTTFLMAAATDNTIANIWYWTFDTPSTAPTITWPQAITAWNGGSAPTINASKHYEVSVMNGIACIIEA